ncbi:hypothetical protein K0M31_013989, partial [Melipona bicolor]
GPIPRLRDSNTRLAQAASGCAPSVEVLPISDVKQAECGTPLGWWNPARMVSEPGQPLAGVGSYNNKSLSRACKAIATEIQRVVKQADEQNDTSESSGGKLMETSINANKYKGNPGHVRKPAQEHANRCRQLKRSRTAE